MIEILDRTSRQANEASETALLILKEKTHLGKCRFGGQLSSMRD